MLRSGAASALDTPNDRPEQARRQVKFGELDDEDRACRVRWPPILKRRCGELGSGELWMARFRLLCRVGLQTVSGTRARHTCTRHFGTYVVRWPARDASAIAPTVGFTKTATPS